MFRRVVASRPEAGSGAVRGAGDVARTPSVGWERRVVPGRGSGEDAMGWRGGCIAPALTSAMLVAFRLAGFDASRTVLRSGGEKRPRISTTFEVMASMAFLELLVVKHQVDELRIADLSSAALNDANLSGANLARARLTVRRRAHPFPLLQQGVEVWNTSRPPAEVRSRRNSPSGAAGRG